MKNQKKISLRTIILIIPLIFLGLSTSLLCINRFQSYIYYERIQFECAGAKLYADFYHPTNKLNFQEKSPLVIVTHGAGFQKSIDVRMAIELTKRGFFVAIMDYQGHGESGGELSDIDPETGRPAIGLDCSKLLDAIEQLDVYKQIDSSQIGLLGHSLGGLVVIMNGMLDSRFSATVSWAGVVDAPSFGFYNPVNIISPNRPKNLLIIHHVDDGTVSYEGNALIAQRLTGCTVITLTEDIPLGAHYILTDEVLIESIKWFELKFFSSTTKNGPISISWINLLILQVMTYIAFSSSVISIMVFCSKYFFKSDETKAIELSEKKEKKLQALKFFSSIIIYLVIWFGLTGTLRRSSFLITPLIIILIYAAYEIILRKIRSNESILNINFRDTVKAQFDKPVLLYGIFSAGLFLGAYYVNAFSVPFTLFYPHDSMGFLLSMLMLPLYISTEIFYRKVLFPSLSFLKSRKMQTYIVIAVSFFIQFAMWFLSYLYGTGISFFAAFLALLFASIMNGVIYHKTENFTACLLNTFIIVEMFASSATSAFMSMISITF